MDRYPVQSSSIKSVGFEMTYPAQLQGTLEVELKSGGIYQYEPVDKITYEQLIKAESIGKFFAYNIKNNKDIQYKKI